MQTLTLQFWGQGPQCILFNSYAQEARYLPFEEHRQDVRVRTDVLHSGTPRTNLSSQDVVEYLGHIFFSLLKRHITITSYTVSG